MTERTAIERLEAWNEGDGMAIPPGYFPDGSWFQDDLRALLATVKRRGDILCAILEAHHRSYPHIPFRILGAATGHIRPLRTRPSRPVDAGRARSDSFRRKV